MKRSKSRSVFSPVAAGVAALALAVTTLGDARVARANGRFPAANQLVATPGAPERLVLRTTFGILFSNDAGKNWDWVCERAVGYGGVWDPPMGVFANGTVMAGTIDGLALSPDHGCAWGYAGGVLDKRAIVDVVVRPDSPNQGMAIASSSSGQDDAGAPLFLTQVFATIDGGQHWSALANDFPASFTAQTIEVAASDAARVYVSGTIAGDGALFVSSDGGKTFANHAITLERPNERAPFIAAVSPTDADRLYVRTGGATSRLLVSDDGGKTFRTVFMGPRLPGFALSTDGTRVWIGSENGVFAATATELAFAKVSDAPASCLFAAGTTLYACAGSTALPYALGVSTDLGKTFAPVLTLNAIRGPIACGAGTAAVSCAADWPALQQTLNPIVGGDDAGTVADGGPAAVSALRAGGGCSASTTARATGGWLVAGLALAIATALRLSRSALRPRTRPFRGSR